MNLKSRLEIYLALPSSITRVVGMIEIRVYKGKERLIRNGRS